MVLRKETTDGKRRTMVWQEDVETDFDDFGSDSGEEIRVCYEDYDWGAENGPGAGWER